MQATVTWRAPKLNNPFYPLHPDHDKFSPEEAKADRLRALTIQETPEDLVYGWALFRSWYLRQLPEGSFYKRYKDSPPFHYQIIRDIGEYPYNAIAAPRGSAKSTILAVELPLYLLLTRPHFAILLVVSKETMVTKRMRTQIANQLENNPFIKADFGNMKPPARGGSWNAHALQLNNGAIIEACSVRGGMQGQRPDLILVDDAEFDPVLQKITPELTENYSRLLMEVLFPMMDRGGSSFYWIGTLLSKQCFLYHAVTDTDDQRFNFWNRRLLDAEDDGTGKLLWPDKWSQEFLDQEREMDPVAYDKNRRNRPGSGQNPIKIHPHLNQYEVLGDYEDDPLRSKAVIRSWKSHKPELGDPSALQTVERPFGETVSRMFRVLTMDYARCLTPISDYVAIGVTGIETSKDYKNTWWELDLLLERLPGDAWIQKFWSMMMKWRVHYAAVEAIGPQVTLLQSLETFRSSLGPNLGWSPRIIPLKYPPGLSKEERISGLGWRFRDGKIKYPKHLRKKWPYSELYHETDSFTGLPGGSKYDDAIDRLAMVQYVVGRGRTSGDDGSLNAPSGTIYDRLMRGDTHIETASGNIPLITALDPDQITAELVLRSLSDQYDAQIAEQKAYNARPTLIRTL